MYLNLYTAVLILKYSADIKSSLAQRQQCQIGQSRTHHHLLINFLIYYPEWRGKKQRSDHKVIP